MSYVVGDKVRLNSGGPIMTVESIVGSKASCVWFVDKAARRDSFEVSMLKAPEPTVIATVAYGSRSRGGW